MISRELRSASEEETIAAGRELGRQEGEELIRKRVHAVSVEMYKVIQESTPLRSHFKGCYVIHPECAVKALGRSAGLVTRPVGLSRAG